MIIKLILSITALAVTFLTFPAMAGAAEVAWTSETYHAYAHAQTDLEGGPPIYDEFTEENFSPSTPLTASAYVETFVSPFLGGTYVWGDAQSDLSSSSFVVSAGSESFCCEAGHADAIASFTGTFTASSPYFKFYYDLSTSYTSFNYGTPTDYVGRYDGWLTVNSLTGGTTLLDMSLSAGSDTISIVLPYGHDIEVFFGIEAFSDYPIIVKGGATRDATLTFSASVVPEPVSAILFVTGGTLLAGRRLLKRKKNA